MSTDKIETHRIVTRGYELSSRGAIGPAQLVRYLEHSRWQTISNSSKIPVRRFWTMGVVRAQALEIHRELSFDVEIETSTWMSRLGKTSITFSHETHRVSDGALLFRSSATIVALDSERRPQVISDEARQYMLERDALAVERLEGAVSPNAWEHAVHIRPSDQDLQQHVNHARYLDFVEDTRWFAARAGGYGSGAWDGPVRRITVAYEREARVFDPLMVHTWVAGNRVLDFVLRKDPQTIAARARVEVLG